MDLLQQNQGAWDQETDFSVLVPILKDIARSVFGIEKLTNEQIRVMESLHGGQDCLTVLPTGSGKSLCYALPAALSSKLTIVVSPLIALIRDQVRRMSEHGIPVAHVDSMQSREEKVCAWENVKSGTTRILFVSPERLARIPFREKMSQIPIGLIAIDEAHCVSQWGEHFRPEYRKLGSYINDISTGQRLALTATATNTIQQEIIANIGLVQPEVVVGRVTRSNLELTVHPVKKVSDQLTAVLNFVQNESGAGIVYAPTRKKVDEVARMLGDAGVSVVNYHAGLSTDKRLRHQRRFEEGTVQVMVATQAFGMGIDKRDIRFIIHAGLPGSLEQYVQEVGRAGRDGLDARCRLIFNARDYHIRKYMIEKSMPDPGKLRDTLDLSIEILAGAPKGHQGISSDRLARELASRTLIDGRDLDNLLDIFFREGLLQRYSAGSWGDDVVEYPNLDSEASFFSQYPTRRASLIDKLDAIRSYAELGENRIEYLETYFSSPVDLSHE